MDDTINAAAEPELACALIGAELAARKETIGQELFGFVEQVDELPDGYAFRLPGAEPWAAKALEFIALEKRCCPFFTFELVFEPEDGPLWLRLRGSERIKAFIQTELAGILPSG